MIAPFPDHCLFVPFFKIDFLHNKKNQIKILFFFYFVKLTYHLVDNTLHSIWSTRCGRSSLTNEKHHHYFMNKVHVCR